MSTQMKRAQTVFNPQSSKSPISRSEVSKTKTFFRKQEEQDQP